MDKQLKIFAIGDIHGDIEPLVVCLRDCCNVIKKKDKFNFKQNKYDIDLYKQMTKKWDDKTYVEDLNYKWIGGNSIIVFCGDFLDNVRGVIEKKPQEYPFEEARIFKFINAINKKAMEAGGRIYKVLGNHDMYNLNGKTKDSYFSYVSTFAKNYEGYKQGAENRLDYFNQGNPGAHLIGEDGAYLFLMIKDFIFVHGGISSSLLNLNNITQLNNSLMKFIYDKGNHTLDSQSETMENQLTFTNDDNDGLVHDRFFGFKKGKSEEELCSSLYNKFKNICRDITDTLDDKTNLGFINVTDCNPDKMKLVIGHCNQNKNTSDANKIFKSSFSKLVKENKNNDFVFSEEFGAPVYKGEPVNTKENKAIYGITVSCGDRNDKGDMNEDIPSIFRIDVGMSRGFNVREYSDDYVYSRTPQVLKIQYSGNKPTMTIIKSSLKNTLIHVKDMDVNPYKGKYIKYKSKYLSLLDNYNEFIKKNEK
jgi:hypothetical protein